MNELQLSQSCYICAHGIIADTPDPKVSESFCSTIMFYDHNCKQEENWHVIFSNSVLDKELILKNFTHLCIAETTVL